jgi:hypothetical protein
MLNNVVMITFIAAIQPTLIKTFVTNNKYNVYENK